MIRRNNARTEVIERWRQACAVHSRTGKKYPELKESGDDRLNAKGGQGRLIIFAIQQNQLSKQSL